MTSKCQSSSYSTYVNLYVKLVNIAQTEHEFLCFINKNKKDTYGIRRIHSMNIKCIESNRTNVFRKNIFSKISQNSHEKPASESLLSKVTGLGHNLFLLISLNS